MMHHQQQDVVILGQDYQSCTYNIALPLRDTTGEEEETVEEAEDTVDGGEDEDTVDGEGEGDS